MRIRNGIFRWNSEDHRKDFKQWPHCRKEQNWISCLMIKKFAETHSWETSQPSLSISVYLCLSLSLSLSHYFCRMWNVATSLPHKHSRLFNLSIQRSKNEELFLKRKFTRLDTLARNLREWQYSLSFRVAFLRNDPSAKTTYFFQSRNVIFSNTTTRLSFPVWGWKDKARDYVLYSMRLRRRRLFARFPKDFWSSLS